MKKWKKKIKNKSLLTEKSGGVGWGGGRGVDKRPKDETTTTTTFQFFKYDKITIRGESTKYPNLLPNPEASLFVFQSTSFATAATNNHHHRISPQPQTASTLSNPLQRSPLMPQVKAHNSRRLHTGKVILGIWGLCTHKIWIFKHYIVLRMLIGLYWYILGLHTYNLIL